MKTLFLTLACGDYDRTKSLRDGTVQPEGLRINYIALESEEIFWRMIKYQEFDASEMSLSNYITMRSYGDCSYVAIPVFPSRFFRHSCLYINTKSGIKSPGDLRGKRIGNTRYSMTAAVWVRGFLQDDYGIAPKDVEWFVGGQEEPGRRERLTIQLPSEINLSAIPEDKTLSGLLEAGEIDALIAARIPSCYSKKSPHVARLFPNYKETEIDYYRRTKIFPIMHVFVIKKELHDQHPWIAKSLYRAFCSAKERCLEAMHTSITPVCMIPWLGAEIEELENTFGRDWWPYGIESNRHTLEALIRYMRDQGLLGGALTPDDLFPDL
jgi:4,5-dihydroxyphthalate decarboxylase